MFTPTNKSMLFCSICGIAISLSIIPHNCIPKPFSQAPFYSGYNVACEVLGEKHDHTIENNYSTSTVTTTTSGTAATTGTSTTTTL